MLNYRHNVFLILRTVFGTLRHTDWQQAHARAGLWGLLRAFVRALIGANAWPFFVKAGNGWSREQLAILLRSRGVASWGWGYSDGELFFRVRMRQAHWAQYVLLEQGVPLTRRLLAESPDATQTGYWRYPQPGQARKKSGKAHQPAPHTAPQPTAQPTSQPTAQRSPVDAINHVVDKLAGL
jgi:hypothetical protein